MSFENIHSRVTMDISDVLSKTGRLAAATRRIGQGFDDIGTKAATGAKRVGTFFKEIDDKGDKLGRFSSGMRTAAATFAGFGAAQAAGLAIRKFTEYVSESIDVSADFEQQIGAIEAVYGNFSDKVLAGQSSAAFDFGLSNPDFLKYQVALGALFQDMGASAQEAYDLTRQTMKLSSDIGAGLNVDPSEGMEGFLAAIGRGEFQQIERLNIRLKVSTVEARALADGLAATGKELTDLDKARTIIAMAGDQGSKFLDQFDRERDQAAGKLVQAAAAMGNAQVTLGNALIPALGAFAGNLSETVAPAIERLAMENGPQLEQFGLAASELLGRFIEMGVEGAPAILELADAALPFLEGAATAAEALAPIIRDVAEAFASLPAPVQTALVMMKAFDSQIIALSGALLKIPSVSAAAKTALGAAAGLAWKAIPYVGATVFGVKKGLDFSREEEERANDAVRSRVEAMDNPFDMNDDQSTLAYQRALLRRQAELEAEIAGSSGILGKAWKSVSGSARSEAVLLEAELEQVEAKVAEVEDKLGTPEERNVSRAATRADLARRLGLDEGQVIQLLGEMNDALLAADRATIDLHGNAAQLEGRFEAAAIKAGMIDVEARAAEEAMEGVVDVTSALAKHLDMSAEQLAELADAASEVGGKIAGTILGFGDFKLDDPVESTKKLESATDKVASAQERVVDAQRELADLVAEREKATLITPDDLEREADLRRNIADAERDLAKAHEESNRVQAEAKKENLSPAAQIKKQADERVAETERFVNLMNRALGSGLSATFLLDAFQQGPQVNDYLETIIDSPSLVATITSTETRLNELAAEAGGIGEALQHSVDIGTAGLGNLAGAVDLSKKLLEDDLAGAIQVIEDAFGGVNGELADLLAKLDYLAEVPKKILLAREFFKAQPPEVLAQSPGLLPGGTIPPNFTPSPVRPAGSDGLLPVPGSVTNNYNVHGDIVADDPADLGRQLGQLARLAALGGG